MSFEHIKKNHVNSKNNTKSQFNTRNDEELKQLIKETVSNGMKVEKGDTIIYEKSLIAILKNVEILTRTKLE